MGNDVSGAYVRSPRTKYTVHCHQHTWINVYEGYDEGSYNYYRNNSGNCWKCADEENERQRQLAEERARVAKRAEIERVRKLKERLKREEKERQENERLERERLRKIEDQKLLEERQKREQERLKIQQDLIRQSEEKIEAELERLKSIPIKNPYIAFKKCDTLQVVKEISNKAVQYAVAGEIICERVDVIKKELKKSLKHDYDNVKHEIDRYEKYGNEMKSMTTVFINEFSKVFDNKGAFGTNVQAEFKENAEQYDEAKGDGDKDEEDFWRDEMKDNVTALSTAIRSMKFKLLLMDQYYEKMKQDYTFFIKFIGDKSYEYAQQKNDIISYINGISTDIANKGDRDIFEGTDHKQKEFIEEKYDIIRVTTEETDIVSGGGSSGGGSYWKEGVLMGGAAGAIAGGVQGVVAGVELGSALGVALGPLGFCAGAVCGALLGGIIGSLFKKKRRRRRKPRIIGTEKRSVQTVLKNAGSVKLDIDKQYYDGYEHSKALCDIKDSMKKQIDDFITEMKEKKQTIQDQLNNFVALQSDVKILMKEIDKFKTNVDVMKQALDSSDDIKESQRNRLEQKWKETSAKIQGMLQSMKNINNK